MTQLLYFYLPFCPHCRLATGFLEKLKAENPAYAQIPVTMIDESRQVAFANSFDYWYVPCFFLNGKKLHEGHAERRDIQRILEATRKEI